MKKQFNLAKEKLYVQKIQNCFIHLNCYSHNILAGKYTSSLSIQYLTLIFK